MKLTPSSTARRRTAIASVRFLGGPQMPSPVRRIAPNPRRYAETSPPSKTLPAKLADISFAFIIPPEFKFSFTSDAMGRRLCGARVRSLQRLFLSSESANVCREVVSLTLVQRSFERGHSILAVGNDLGESRAWRLLDCF